jgi:hypothetical protein
MPHYMFCPRQKKIISRTFKIRGTLVFLCPKERERQRERERERESKSKSESESESKSESRKGEEKEKGTGKGTGKGKGKERERESTKALAIFFLNRLGQSEKSANYTLLYRKERYSMYSQQSLGIVDYILSR